MNALIKGFPNLDLGKDRVICSVPLASSSPAEVLLILAMCIKEKAVIS